MMNDALMYLYIAGCSIDVGTALTAVSIRCVKCSSPDCPYWEQSPSYDDLLVQLEASVENHLNTVLRTSHAGPHIELPNALSGSCPKDRQWKDSGLVGGNPPGILRLVAH